MRMHARPYMLRSVAIRLMAGGACCAPTTVPRCPGKFRTLVAMQAVSTQEPPANAAAVRPTSAQYGGVARPLAASHRPPYPQVMAASPAPSVALREGSIR